MSTAKLRQIGGSIVVAIPPAHLKQLHLSADSAVEISVENHRLIIKPNVRPRYTLDQIMSKCDLTAPGRRSKAEREFMDAPRRGKEEI